MIEKHCRVCGHDITGRWPAQVCSTLCRMTVKREKARRKARTESRRKASARREARRIERKRQARVEIRKHNHRIRQRLRNLASRLDRFNPHKMLDNLATRLRRFKPKPSRNRTPTPEERERKRLYERTPEARERKRLRELSLHYRQQKKEREKRRTAKMIPIHALREMGWLDGYDFIMEPKPKPDACVKRRSHEPKPPKTKYQKVIAAYAPQYQSANKQQQKLIRDQIKMVFYPRADGLTIQGWRALANARNRVALDLRQKRNGGDGSHKKYIVDSQGNVIESRKVWKKAYAPRRQLKEEERRSKRRAILAALDQLDILPMERAA